MAFEDFEYSTAVLLFLAKNKTIKKITAILKT